MELRARDVETFIGLIPRESSGGQPQSWSVSLTREGFGEIGSIARLSCSVPGSSAVDLSAHRHFGSATSRTHGEQLHRTG